MKSPKIRELFATDVTRPIPPVVYFHEQSPEKLQEEVSEYIITGGWPKEHPKHKRVPDGIHEQYVRLLENLAEALRKAEGTDLPNVWISGFYGSGKSSFAKLLGLALDGVELPDGRSLAAALLERDHSPNHQRLRKAWDALIREVPERLAVVFDVGSAARDGEQIHATAIRQLQHHLGYSRNPLVASFELRLERDGSYERFVSLAGEVLGKPWVEAKDGEWADEGFSQVMAQLFPDRYPEPMSWFEAQAGLQESASSPQEAVAAIRDMLSFRKPKATVFFVIDEVSQYLQGAADRSDRLRAFATALGAELRGKVWLLALGQQKLEEVDGTFLEWTQARFPPQFRVHLAATNIRDVVHQRLLRKTEEGRKPLLELFERHRHELRLYAYGCQDLDADEFVEVYPLLPGHIDLLLQITSALRTRSSRAQGDVQAIRGLLQILGQLFKDQELADRPVGTLVSWDAIYDIQQTALDSEVQSSMARILAHCASAPNGQLLAKTAKTVALLELIQEVQPTTPEFVAQCLYDRADRGNNLPEIKEALETLRQENFLGYSEKEGYRIHSFAAVEWEQERQAIPVNAETLSGLVQKKLGKLLNEVTKPSYRGRPFPYRALYSDGRRAVDAHLLAQRAPEAIEVDFRYLPASERGEAEWIRRSAESTFRNRLIWVAGEPQALEDLLRGLVRSKIMIDRNEKIRESLSPARRLLLQQEKNEEEDLSRQAQDAVAATWMAGTLYFRGASERPSEHGEAFGTSLVGATLQALPTLFPHFIPIQVLPAELAQLLEASPSGLSPKFMEGKLGLFQLDRGRYLPSLEGLVPRQIAELIDRDGGVSGESLLAHFGRPPYGYTPEVVKACVAALLHAGRLKVRLQTGSEITAVTDVGAKDFLLKVGDFTKAEIFPAGEDDIGPQVRARICSFLERSFGLEHVERNDQSIANAAVPAFLQAAGKQRQVLERLAKLPGAPEGPAVLQELGRALESCLQRMRQAKPTVQQIRRHLQTLQDGMKTLAIYHAELSEPVVAEVQQLYLLFHEQVAQLRATDTLPPELEEAAQQVEAQLASSTPWREIAKLAAAAKELHAAYVAQRRELLAWQQLQVEKARDRVRRREGFSLLTAKKAEAVMEPLLGVTTDTSDEAVAPRLVDLQAPFSLALQRAEDEAQARFDRFASEGEGGIVRPLSLRLEGRELRSEAEVEALVQEIRKRLLDQIQQGGRIRLT